MTKEQASTAGTGKAMLYIFWLLVLIGLSYMLGLWENKQYNPNQKLVGEQGDGRNIVQLKRNRFGHYVSNGKINGHNVTFMLDTGATSVAIPAGVADKLGLQRGPSHKVHTANGTATAYSTRIARLKLGSIELEDLRASITPGMQGSEILLGMSALKQLDFSQSGDVLTLIQYN
ncbi:retropepsin-like aspartic protease family protein [Agaribacterium haliotis]|uniref:retropepsin-like aspartic protease family protein n=1 Tax=Agaribacterium haliotis TaxID=2013869 RepID=UPI000BB55095|nr:TIGR02281 family clan AA aspartic protease [Agaribacterium haliotis]